MTSTASAIHIGQENGPGNESAALYKKAAFFHVPKTAGTTLGDHMSKWFKPEESWQQSNTQDFLTFREGVSNGSLKFVSGHLKLKEDSVHFDHTWLKLCVLRSPLTYLPSQFNHYRQLHNHDADINQRIFNEARTRDLAHFLREGRGEDFRVLFDNPQLRFILGCRDPVVTEEHLEEAMELLSQCQVVGVRERLLQTAHLLSLELGQSAPMSLPSLRTGGLNHQFQAETAPREEVEAIFERTEMDERLFRWVWNRLDSQINELEFQAGPPLPISAEAKPIMLSDVFLNENRKVRNAIWGNESMILGNQVVLHPPPPEKGSAQLWMDGLMLTGHSVLSTVVKIPNIHGPAITFTVSVLRGDRKLASTSVTINSGHESPLSLMLPDQFGRVTVKLETRVAPGYETNSYGTAIFDRARLA